MLKPYFKEVVAIVVLIALAFTAISCSLLPVSNDSKEIFRSIEKEYAEEGRFKLYDLPEFKDTKVNQYLNKLTANICAHYKLPTLSVKVTDSIEAQGLIEYGSGTIFISRGMIHAVKSEAELIAVLAHEVGHKKLHHYNREPDGSKVPAIIGDIFEQATGIEIADELGSEIEDLNFSQFSKQLEKEADEFSALAAHKLGYSSYAFVRLLTRLHEKADQNILMRLKNISGSHPSLGERAQRIRQHLEAQKIPDTGRESAEIYLNNVGQIAAVKDPTKAALAAKSLEEIVKRLTERTQNNERLSVEEFLRIMRQIQSAANDLNLLAQLRSRATNAQFMLERVPVPEPWWQPGNAGWQNLETALTLLGRMGVGAIPIVGDAIDLYEVLTGQDFYTGEDLTFGERVASALGLLIGSGQQWRATSDALEALKVPRNISSIVDPKEVSDAAKAAREAIEEAPIFGRKSTDPLETAKDGQEKYRHIKNEKNLEVLKGLAKEAEEKGIPDDWVVKVSKVKSKDKLQGLEYVHPEDRGIRIRVMPGDPNSRFPNSREPYVIQKVHNKFIDRYGNIVKKIQTNLTYLCEIINILS